MRALGAAPDAVYVVLQAGGEWVWRPFDRAMSEYIADSHWYHSLSQSGSPALALKALKYESTMEDAVPSRMMSIQFHVQFEIDR